TFETRQAQQDSPIDFLYDKNLGGFEERPGAPCNHGQNNPTYFKLSLHSNIAISSCRYQASWDNVELACPQSAVDLLNQGTEITLNTDDFATNPDPHRCGDLLFPRWTILLPGQTGFMRLRLNIGGATYVRRLDFLKHVP